MFNIKQQLSFSRELENELVSLGRYIPNATTLLSATDNWHHSEAFFFYNEGII